MKKEYKIGLLLLFLSLPLFAGQSYRSVLKKWTRHDRVFVWDNLEARLVWYATYLSEDYREKRRERLAGLYEWTAEERGREERQDQGESQRYDAFFLGVYSGSSAWPEIGKDSGKWKIVLEVEGREPVPAVSMERIPLTQVERTLYPYLDKWSEGYLVKFPKQIGDGEKFRLRMTGIPARSELMWK